MDVNDFRSAIVTPGIALPPCCCDLLIAIDDMLVLEADAKRWVFIASIVDVINIVFAGDPRSGPEEAAQRKIQEIVLSVGTDAISDANEAPGMPEFLAGLNQMERGKVLGLIVPHITYGYSGACKKLHDTILFWKKMLVLFGAG